MEPFGNWKYGTLWHLEKWNLVQIGDMEIWNLVATGRSTSPPSPAWPGNPPASPSCFQNHDPTWSSSHFLSPHTFHISLGSKGWALTWCPSLASPTRAATAIMNPIKALGLNDGGGLEASLAGLGRPPGISAPSLPSKASARSHWPGRAFELSAQGQLDQ